MNGTETEFEQAWGTWLSDQLRQKQWSGADLRRAIEARGGSVGASQVSRWVNGEQRPSVKGARLVADALGVDRREAFAIAGHDEDTAVDDGPVVVVSDPAEAFVRQIRARRLPAAVEDRLIAEVRADIERRRQALETTLDTVELAVAAQTEPEPQS